jgi:transposase
MARFIQNSRNQGLLLCVDLDNQLIQGSLEKTIDYLVEEQLNLNDLLSDFHNDIAGAPAYHPKDLLKVLFLAFLRGIFSCRKIEQLCNENIVFMALSGDLHPDHATIARFINRLQKHIVSLFQQLLIYCDSLDLISGTHIAIDGCKISSNAAKESSGTLTELKQKMNKFKLIAEQIVEEAQNTDNPEAVQKRIAKYNHKIDRINTFLKNNEERIGTQKRIIKSNITDNESAKLTSGHGVLQGYYALAAVDAKHQIITSAKAVGTQNEGKYLKDMIECSRNILPKRITTDTTVLADTGYFSEANCKYLFESNQNAIVPDNHFRQRDSRFGRDVKIKDINNRRKGRRLFDHDQFIYNEKKNWYYYLAGKALRPNGKRNLHGHIGRQYIQKDGNCDLCHLRSKCLQKNSKRRYIFIVDIPKPMTFSQKMKKIIDSPEERNTYLKRMGIVEPVFGNITRNKSLSRFNYRGSIKVNIVWKLYCMVHNIEKIHNYGTLE